MFYMREQEKTERAMEKKVEKREKEEEKWKGRGQRQRERLIS